MSDIKIFSFVSLGALALMYISFFTRALSPVPSLGLIFITMGLLLGWVSIKLTRTWNALSPTEKDNFRILNELRWFFVVGALFFSVDLVPHVVLPIIYPEPSTVTIAHWLAHLVLFINSILAARIAVAFFNPELKNVVSVAVALIGLSALVVSLFKPDTLVYIPISKYPLIQSDRLFAWFNLLSNLASFGFAGVYLLIRGLMSPSTVVKTRALLLAIGMFCAPFIGYLIHFVVSPYLPLMLYTLFVAWAGFMGASALYTSEKRV